MTNNPELIELSSHLARHRPRLDPEVRPLVSTLAEQCKRFHQNPDGLRPMMLATIAAIEEVG